MQNISPNTQDDSVLYMSTYGSRKNRFALDRRGPQRGAAQQEGIGEDVKNEITEKGVEMAVEHLCAPLGLGGLASFLFSFAVSAEKIKPSHEMNAADVLSAPSSGNALSIDIHARKSITGAPATGVPGAGETSLISKNLNQERMDAWRADRAGGEPQKTTPPLHQPSVGRKTSFAQAAMRPH